MEVSALNNENDCVGRAFNLLIEGSSTYNSLEIVKKKEKDQKMQSVTASTGVSVNLTDDKQKKEKKGCC